MTRFAILLIALMTAQVGGLGTLTRTFPGSTVPANCVGTVSCWYMNEGTGATFLDYSGNANNATAGSPSNFAWQSNSGFPGTTPLFSGTWANVDGASATPTNFSTSTPFSVSMWVTFASFGSENDLASNLSSSDQGYVFYVYNPGSGCQSQAYYIGDGAGNYLFAHAGAGDCFTTAGPNLLVWTYDGSANCNGVHIYTNTTDVTSYPCLTNGTLGSIQSGLPFSIDSKPGGSGPTAAVIAFTRVWSTALTSAQVSTLYGLGPQ